MLHSFFNSLARNSSRKSLLVELVSLLAKLPLLKLLPLQSLPLVAYAEEPTNYPGSSLEARRTSVTQGELMRTTTRANRRLIKASSVRSTGCCSCFYSASALTFAASLQTNTNVGWQDSQLVATTTAAVASNKWREKKTTNYHIPNQLLVDEAGGFDGGAGKSNKAKLKYFDALMFEHNRTLFNLKEDEYWEATVCWNFPTKIEKMKTFYASFLSIQFNSMLIRRVYNSDTYSYLQRKCNL